MNDQTMKRAIGLAVLIIVVIGLPLVLSNYFGPQNESVNNTTMRQITIETNPSSGGSESASHPGKKSGKPDFAKRSESSSVPSNQGGRADAHPESIAADSESKPAGNNPVQAEPPEKSSQMAAMPDQSSKRQSTSPVSPESGADERQVANSTPPDEAESGSADSQGGPEPAEKSTRGEGDWVVQIASFGTLEHAKTFMSRMNSQYASFYVVGEVDGTTYYRVRIGPFVSEDEAERVADELATEKRQPYVVHR